jgi:hypothetical protein
MEVPRPKFPTNDSQLGHPPVSRSPLPPTDRTDKIKSRDIMADPFKTLDTAPGSDTANQPSPISQKTYPVAGILTTVFGLEELPSQATEVSCLWLLHPRLAAQERMTGIATAAITDWNNRIRAGHNESSQPLKGLIAVAFDQRNHGTRLVDPLGNEAWKQGNPRHAQDMFSIFRECLRIFIFILCNI